MSIASGNMGKYLPSTSNCHFGSVRMLRNQTRSTHCALNIILFLVVVFYFLCELIFQDDLESHDQKLAELTALGSKLIELSQVLQLLHYFQASRVLFSVLFVCLLCFA